MVIYKELFIDGQLIAPSSGSTIEVFSPNTEQKIGQVPAAEAADIDVAVTAARRAFDDPKGWASWAPTERATVLERMADELESRAPQIAESVAAQNGMPITIANQLEGFFPLTIWRYYAQLIREVSLEETRAGLLGGRARVRKVPVGVVAAITAWNYPNFIATLKVAPALAMGCTVVLKPSPQTVLDTYLLAEAAQAAGIPDGVINIVPGGVESGSYLVAHAGVDKVSFTGSVDVGRRIATACGPLLRPITLELGGKSAAIILEDADLSASLEGLLQACLLNNGQTCILNSRVLAPRSRYDETIESLSAVFGSLQVGDSLDPVTQIGPLVSSRQRERVEGYIASARSDGARLISGGGRPAGLDRGWFVEPTLFADVDPVSKIAQEEIFGPVVTVIPYRDLDEAVTIANCTEYGLAGTIWTADEARGEELSRRIETGTIGVNTFLPDPVAPFGGIKSSGIGREMGPEGMAAYQQNRSIYLGPV